MRLAFARALLAGNFLPSLAETEQLPRFLSSTVMKRMLINFDEIPLIDALKEINHQNMKKILNVQYFINILYLQFFLKKHIMNNFYLFYLKKY